jgi:hypothetical protein
MRRLIAPVLLFAAAGAFAQVPQRTFTLHGFVSARAVRAGGVPSWTTGGFGRLETAGGSSGSDATRSAAVTLLAAEWTPSRFFDLHVQGTVRRDPSGTRGSKAGITDAYVDILPLATVANELQIRAGMFFLPTSRENIEDLWTSPYTITFSALNSWMAEEVRPLGADLQYRHRGSSTVTLALTGFRGNDTSGTLLGWRGWSMGNRLSTWGELLPLPPLRSLSDPSMFGAQRHGTEPFGADLDHRGGWSARARWTLPGRITIQATHFDNRADRHFYRDQYAWRTKFNLAGIDVHPWPSTVLAMEYLSGSTGMGFAPHALVQADIRAFYALLSQSFGHERLTLRHDRFATDDRDGSVAESNTERGTAWTVAWFHQMGAHSRLGLEYVRVSADRLAALQSGFPLSTDGHTLTAEIRYGF